MKPIAPLFIANWKMQLTVPESVSLARQLHEQTSATQGTIVLCPSFTAIASIRTELPETHLKLGAQDIFYEDRGAFTGAVSPLMVKEYASYVIVGHSERRAYFHEDDAVIGKKVAAALRHELIPVICVGETAEERSSGQSEAVVSRQLRAALAEVKTFEHLVIAYEPVWAISANAGAGAAQTNDVQQMKSVLQSIMNESFGALANNVVYIYGGSVDANNIQDYVNDSTMQGALIGSASQRLDSFLSLIGAVNK